MLLAQHPERRLRILITGETGQIGSALIERLRSVASIVATGRASLDLSRPKDIPRLLDGLAPEVVINAAAYTAVDRAEEEPDLARLVNAEAPDIMAVWTAERNIPLIHFSTDYVFAGTGERPWLETDAPAPLSVYGVSKREGETHICRSDGPCLILRTSWVYASRGTNFLRTIARLAQSNEELRVVADQIGAPTPAALIAEAVANMLAGGLDDLRARIERTGPIVHLAANGETSWHGFASEIVDGLRARGMRLAVERVVPIESRDRLARATRPRNSRLSLARLEAGFGITPPHWRDALMPELDQLARDMAAR